VLYGLFNYIFTCQFLASSFPHSPQHISPIYLKIGKFLVHGSCKNTFEWLCKECLFCGIDSNSLRVPQCEVLCAKLFSVWVQYQGNMKSSGGKFTHTKCINSGGKLLRAQLVVLAFQPQGLARLGTPRVKSK